MDLYFKMSKKKHSDGDVHLIGVVCMYIASKLNDIYHIPLEEVFSKIAHRKF